eukprot:9848245-Karenia_brevis.AAC.1
MASLLANASSQRQQQYSQRLTPKAGLGEAARIKPEERSCSPWVRSILRSQSGPFFGVKFDDNHKHFVFATGVGSACWGFHLGHDVH